MINYFSIPGFDSHFTLNIKLLELMQKYPYKFKDNVIVDSIYDCFPSCCWMGGRVNHFDTRSPQDMVEIMNIYADFGVQIRHVFTNSLIKGNLVYDILGNKILELSPKGTGININSEELKDYIETNYSEKKFQFNWSATKLLETPKEINTYSKNNLTIPSFMGVNNNFEILEQLEYRDNIELVVDDICYNYCPKYSLHFKEFDKEQLYDLDSKSFICDCEQSMNYYERRVGKHHNISPEDIENKYNPLGFHKWKITGREAPDVHIVESYVRYLVKPEEKDWIRMELLLS